LNCGAAADRCDGRARGGLLTIAVAAEHLGENVDLVDQILSNSDNLDERDLMRIHDGSDVGITAITGRGIEAVEELLADIRSWPGGIRQFLIDDHCDPEIIECIMADEAKS
jgi:hypothetical protein